MGILLKIAENRWKSLFHHLKNGVLCRTATITEIDGVFQFFSTGPQVINLLEMQFDILKPIV